MKQQSQETHLGTRRVNPDGAVQLIFGNSTFHGGSEALCDLTGVWTQIVEADHTFLHRDDSS